MVTYAIDAATGVLRSSATQEVGDAHTLTGEPKGRYVFAAFGPRGGPPYWDPSVVAYAPDPVSGSLTALSEASSDPIWCRGCASWGRSGRWNWLAASSTRVYGVWFTGTYHDVYHAYVTHTVGNRGQLGPAYVREFGEWDPGQLAVDMDTDPEVLYKGTETGGLSAHFIEPDGSLTQMGGSDLCVASTVESASPLVAVRGFVFASSYIGNVRTVCSWEGARLAPRTNLGLQSNYAVALAAGAPSGVPPAASASIGPTLVAMRMTVPTTGQYEVRLFAMAPSGDLESLDAVAGTGWVLHLAFHPSGRFLYVSRAAAYSRSLATLDVYAIAAQRSLALVQTLEDGGGTMAVTSH